MEDKTLVIKLSTLKDIANQVRAKTGTTELIKVPELDDSIAGITGGGELFNIYYGLTPPEDTSKLWVKLESAPSKVEVCNNVSGGNEKIDLLEQVLPRPMGDMGCAEVDGKIYIISGSNNDGEYDAYSSTIYVFDPNDGTFTLVHESFTRSEGAALSTVAVGKKIYMISPKGSYNHVYIYDTETNEWSYISSALSNDFWHRSASVVDSNIYIFGGYFWKQYSSAKYTNTIFLYNTVYDASALLNVTLPTSSYGICSAAVDKKIYLFHADFNSIYIFDTETKQVLSTGIALPTSYTPTGAISIGSNIYLFYSNSIYKFDTINQTSEYICSIPTSAPENSNSSWYRRGYCKCGDDIYIFGGGNKVIDIIYKFSTSYNVEDHKLVLLNKQGGNKINILNDPRIDMNVEIEMALLGNSDNKGEKVEYAIHNGTEWVSY